MCQTWDLNVNRFEACWPHMVFLSKVLKLSHCFSPHSCINGYSQPFTVIFQSGTNPVMDQHPIQGGGGAGVAKLSMVSCYGNQ